MFWIAISFFLFAAVLLLARPFYGSSALNSDLQMQELLDTAKSVKQDEKDQVISKDEAEKLLLTTSERILLLQQSPQANNSLTKADKTVFISLAALVIFGSFGLYLFVGSPKFTSSARNTAPAANQNNTTEPRTLDEAITKLTAHLQNNPEDVESWRLLGWSNNRQNNFNAAKVAYEKALEIAPNDPQTLSAYAETLTRDANDIVTETALMYFSKSLEFEPNNVRSKFYTGLAQQQSGNDIGAIDTWVALLNSVPVDAPWKADLITRVNSLATETNIELPENFLKQSQKAPSAADIAAAEQLSPQQRQEMIQSMVSRLQQRLTDNPDDLAGWKQLIRSQVVLEQSAQATASMALARKAFSQNASALAELEQYAKQQGLAN
ncbi:MAG: c-type cytochrome biogenesis protein CcmI [Robiginitomaculum sp.]|nr:c-type cytochrome biogenesis protein CcmI [Robiginitomaculum sp.]